LEQGEKEIMNSANLNGTGAAIYLGLGNRPPDWVRLQNVESTDIEGIRWNRNMRSAECIEGIQFTGAGTEDELGFGEGIAPYDGGDVTLAGNTAYLVRDPAPDKRQANVANGHAAISAWAIDTVANRTGHWNAEANLTHVGEGSVIRIREKGTGLVKTAVVLAVTSNGEGANEVTLNKAVGAGTIEYLGGMVDFIAAPAGVSMPAGIVINEATNINASGEMLVAEWGWFDSPAMPD
jgi:hypothetical protein